MVKYKKQNMEQEMKLILDRIEKTQNGECIAIFEGDDASYDILEKNMPKDFFVSLKVGMIIETEIINDSLISPKILVDETNQKREDIKSRLSNLFNRNKK